MGGQSIAVLTFNERPLPLLPLSPSREGREAEKPVGVFGKAQNLRVESYI